MEKNGVKRKGKDLILKERRVLKMVLALQPLHSRINTKRRKINLETPLQVGGQEKKKRKKEEEEEEEKEEE